MLVGHIYWYSYDAQGDVFRYHYKIKQMPEMYSALFENQYFQNLEILHNCIIINTIVKDFKAWKILILECFGSIFLW